MKRTPLIGSALLAVAAVVLTACGGGSSSEASGEPSDNILRVATQKPTSIVPGNSGGYFALSVSETLFSGLVKYDSDTGEPVNLVADSIETEDQKVWDITLKDGWTFQNGEVVDAESFARGWNTTADPANAWVGSSQLAGIEGYDALNPDEGAPTADSLSGVEVTGPLSLTVTLTKPQSQFLYQIGQPAFYPLPAAALDDLEAFAAKPIGNGPYEISEPWTGGPEIKTVRYDEYGGEKAENGGVTFKIYTGYDVAYRDFQAGAVDVTALLQQDVESAKATLGDKFVQSASSNFTYLGVPTWSPAYADPRIRRALSLAIDRQGIIDALLDSSTQPLTDFSAPSGNGYRADTDSTNLDYDPERAKQLWDEAGGIDGQVKITVVTGTGRDEWSEAVLNQWATVLGLTDVTLEFIPSENTHAALRGRQVPNPVSLNTPVAYPSPFALLGNAYRTGGGTNYNGYSNPEFDALLDQAAAATNEESTQFYDQAKDILLDELPNIPLWSAGRAVAVADNVEGYTEDPFNKSPFTTVTVA
ncbi:hypothetical protein CH289_05250 [Rhodococcus sp. RS1C4]|nr:ABC transporter substrate-binding protein [Rhodococcus sp. RS1C4]OZC56131.1 hypothetical protein CH289_05250 [Rhodococcus sp. RS1C4]